MNQFKYILLSLIIIISCQGRNDAVSQSLDMESLNWLEGTWNRVGTNDFAHERWEKVSSTEWNGWGITFKGADTSFVEKIKIIKQDNNLYYVADVPENQEPVYFKFISMTKNGFVCENPDHDFPKRIEYKLNGNNLSAIISGDGKSIPFNFQKQP